MFFLCKSQGEESERVSRKSWVEATLSEEKTLEKANSFSTFQELSRMKIQKYIGTRM